MESEKTLHHLNSLLRGEIAAVETYRQAMETLDLPEAKSELEECVQSHQLRVDRLTSRILMLNGSPSPGSGVWGTFAKIVEGTAAAIGNRSAISILEEGEDRGLSDYKADLSDLDPDSLKLVLDELLPAQERTHRSMSALKAAML